MHIEPAVAEAPAAQPATTLKQSLFSGLLLSAVTVILCLALVEFVGFRWERQVAQGPDGWTLVATRRLRFETHGSATYPYDLLEPNREYNWEGVPVLINSRGLRTPEVEVPKPAGTYRILNMGDSFAFGWEMYEEETYGRRLEEQLNLAAQEQQVEVINAGVPRWNTEAARNFLLQEGLEYEPDLLIIEFTVVNDIRGRGPVAESEEGKGLLALLRDHTYSWPFLSVQSRYLMARQQGVEAIEEFVPPSEASDYYPVEESDPQWDEIWGYIEEMALAAQAKDIPTVLLVFPTAFQLNSMDHPPVPQRVLGARAADAGIAFVDLLPVYAAACAAAPAGACEAYQDLLFADVWMHPNDLGNRLAAEQLLPVVQGLIHHP